VFACKKYFITLKHVLCSNFCDSWPSGSGLRLPAMMTNAGGGGSGCETTEDGAVPLGAEEQSDAEDADNDDDADREGLTAGSYDMGFEE
jgi:hypothetical protein